jgi:hypothetical protein
MRKLVILVCVLGLLGAMPSALAQESRRDPFEPLVDENAGVTTVPVGSDTSSGTSDDDSSGSGTSEGTPNTGMATSSWTGLAYLLIVMGAAAVTLARLRRPPVLAARRRR